MGTRTTRWAWIAGGWAALGLGIVGAFLPVIPTTPLVLVAAWCFSKGSKRLHTRLLEHPRFGPMIRDWERHHVIRLRAKILATATIVPLVGYMILFSAAPRWTKGLTVVLVVWGLTFIWTKPTKPPET
ncbi:MAG: YbaN family protein [Gemmatimonadota bacterium]|nr:YbaN family protein [Gemmatimonadota bacterium]